MSYKITYDGVVRAANGACIALRATADPNNADRGAIQSEQDIQVLEDDAKGAQQGSSGGRIGLSRATFRMSS